MKVQLVKTPSPSAAEPTPLPPAEAGALTAASTASQTAPAHHWLNTMTQWFIVAPVTFVSVALLGWSLLIRLPASSESILVQARSLDAIPIPSKPMAEEELGRLRQQAQVASAALIQDRDQLGPLLFSLESSARQLGWRVKVTLKPAVANPAGLTNLTLHPVTFRLDDDAEHSTPATLRLLPWLRSISQLDQRVEVVALGLHSAGAGLAKAEMELNLFSISCHEEAAAE